MNLFAYCNNNPVNMTDSTGHFPFLAITAIVGAVVGAVAGGIIAAKTGNNVWAGIGIGAAGGALLGLGVGYGLAMISGAGALATTGEVMAGLGTVASTQIDKLSQAAQKVCSKVSQVAQKVLTKAPPKNPGVPFTPGQQLGSIQKGVDPNTLIPQKILSSLDPQRMRDAVKFAGDKALQVSQSGVIQQGHHRAADAIANGRAVDVVITVFG